MREATGNALLVGMVASMIGIIMIFFVGSLSYSKAYRIKNYIIDQIEETKEWDNNIEKDVDSYLKDVGYSISRSNNNKCPNVTTNANRCSQNIYNGDYQVCVYKCGSTHDYYKVITYMKFDFPVIGESLKFAVTGDTISFSDFN